MSPGRLIITDAMNGVNMADSCVSDKFSKINNLYNNNPVILPQSPSPSPPLPPLNTSRNSSPPISVRSNHISIRSLDDDDNLSSSVADSDSDLDDLPTTDFIVQSIRAGSAAAEGSSQYQQSKEAGGNGIVVIKQSPTELVQTREKPVKPNIGSIAVQNSSDITFGDKTFYQGPVTIKQFLLENNQWRPRNTADGSDNPAYVSSSADLTAGKYTKIVFYIIAYLMKY